MIQNDSSKTRLTEALAAHEQITLIGVYDVFSATKAAQYSDGLLLTSSSLSASHYGLPDIGLVSWQDLVEFVRRIRAVLPDPVIVVDIEDGFGQASITAHVARELERAGASAVILHDIMSTRNQSPDYKNSLLPTDEFVVKLKEVKRTCSNLFVVTGVNSQSIDFAVASAKAYEAAGADAILLNSVDSISAVKQLSGNVTIPIQVNIHPGAQAEVSDPSSLAKAGVSITGFRDAMLLTVQEQIGNALSAMVTGPDKTVGYTISKNSVEECEDHLLANLQRTEGVRPYAADFKKENPVELDSSVLYKAPLSAIQERMWFLHSFEEDKRIYNVGSAMELAGTIKPELFEQAFQIIVNRHDCLRTVFKMEGDHPVQVVLKELPVEIEFQSYIGLDKQEREIKLEEQKELLKQYAFNLEEAPLSRLIIVSLTETEHEMLYLTHHIISDGWSISIFFSELSECYKALLEGKKPELTALTAQYSDYARFEKEQFETSQHAQDLQYWLDKLGGELPVLELPTDRSRPAYQTFNGSSENYQIPAELTAKLKELSKREGATLFMTLLAAFEVLLSRYSGADEICIGVPIAARNRSEFEQLIGPLINTLVVRNSLPGEKSFSELLREVRNEALESFEHHTVPFEQVVSALNPEREMSRSPVFQALFSYRNFPENPFRIGELSLTPIEFERPTSKFDITLELVENGNGLLALFEYNTDLFEKETIQRMHRQYERILESIVAEPKDTIGSIPLLPDEELHKVMVEWNDTSKGYNLNRTIHSMFEDQALKTPDAVALVAGQDRLTYAELNARCNQVAHRLIALGVKAETRVGVFMKRSADMVVAMIGILKAGGAYVPLDAAYPKNRIALIVEDAELPVIMTDNSLIEQLPDSSAEIISIDNERSSISGLPDSNPDLAISGDNLVYVFYTSGSTGKPKGVALEHSNPVALCLWAQELFSPEEVSGVLFSTSICFDLSVFELFFTLSMGGKVLLAENALALPTLAARAEVTLINTVPSIMAEVVKVGAIPENCQTVTLCGEPLSGELVDDIYLSKQVEKVYDLYGPSEDTTYSTVVLRQPGGPVTIGRPISETQAYVLDGKLQPVPIGVPGELHLSGAGIARGYLGRPELTAEKFIPVPFSSDSSSRMYKTGDLVRWLADGNLEFLGRIDYQVKIRGFRIELGEIESAIRKLSAVHEAIVVAQPTRRGDKQLVAYVVYGDFELTVSELKHTLGQTLPEYMVPVVIVELDEFPQTPNGKIDRKALPNPQEVEETDIHVASETAPATESERIIAGIWKDVLDVSEVNASDNFFDLGGHSLLSMRVIVRIEEQLGVSVKPRDIILQTLRQLAAYCDEVKGGKHVERVAVNTEVDEEDTTQVGSVHSGRPVSGWKAQFDRVKQWRAGS